MPTATMPRGTVIDTTATSGGKGGGKLPLGPPLAARPYLQEISSFPPGASRWAPKSAAGGCEGNVIAAGTTDSRLDTGDIHTEHPGHRAYEMWGGLTPGPTIL